MTTPNPEHGAVEHRLLSDLYTYAPSVFTRLPTVSPLTDETAFSAWAIHLGELWSPARQWAAPSDYDEKYYNRPAEQFQFLDALHRLEAKVWFEVAKDESGKGFFNTSSWEKTMATAGHTKEGASLLVSSGVWKLQNWLAWRELPPFEQFFAALTRVQLDDIENCIWKSDQSEVPPLVFVPDCDPSVEAARFQRLFIEFSRELPRSRETELLLLLDKLAPLRALPSEALREGQVHELPTQFPAISWLGVSNYPEGSRKAETFWSDIKQVLCTRATWAARAFDATAVALDIVMAEKLLGKKPKPSFGNFRLPRIRESLFEVDPYKPADPTVTEPLDTPALILIKSQAQVLSERIAQMVTDAEVSANAQGYTLMSKPGNSVPPAKPQFPATTPPASLTPNKIRFCNGFSIEDADRVAVEIELVDAKNNYIGLPGVAPGRLCGFYKQLKDKKRVSGSLENLRDYFAERYLKRPVSGKPDPKTYVALDTADETQTALERLLLL